MERSLALTLYMTFAHRAVGRANRVLARRLDEGKEDPDRIEERRGAPSLTRPDGRLVWFHAASVGEALSIQELVRRLGDERPELHFLLTTGTRTSAQVLANRMPPHAVHQFVPVDATPFIRRFLEHWQPDLAVWTESEFWPALMVETNKRGVPMLLINARMSDKSHRRWRWLPGAAKSLLSRFDHILAQDRRTAAHLRRLGVAKTNLEVTGTLKEGTAALPCNEAERDMIAAQLKSRPVWLAASTHPGEEEIAADAHRQAMRSAHRLLLIIAPRHPERGPAIAEKLRADGWSVALRSTDDDIDDDTQIYVADTLGEMGLWYRLAPISFMGGSLAKIGGHNPFEPAALGSAILHGPHVTNFMDIYERMTHAGAARLVSSTDELATELRRLQAPDQAAQMAHAAWEVSSAGAHVTDRAIELILDRLDKRELSLGRAS
ncbi:MAG: 3-deoxy-D-manno-octulosonic acid transferase [Brevirhabdus sp.]